eukprot:3667423-Amphidinium_carterae.5
MLPCSMEEVLPCPSCLVVHFGGCLQVFSSMRNLPSQMLPCSIHEGGCLLHQGSLSMLGLNSDNSVTYPSEKMNDNSHKKTFNTPEELPAIPAQKTERERERDRECLPLDNAERNV